jgi:hypothetical protein
LRNLIEARTLPLISRRDAEFPENLERISDKYLIELMRSALPGCQTARAPNNQRARRHSGGNGALRLNAACRLCRVAFAVGHLDCIPDRAHRQRRSHKHRHLSRADLDAPRKPRGIRRNASRLFEEDRPSSIAHRWNRLFVPVEVWRTSAPRLPHA